MTDEPLSDSRPVTITTRVNERNDGHVRVSIFVGRQPGSRGLAGVLTFRVDEWRELHRDGRFTLIEGVR